MKEFVKKNIIWIIIGLVVVVVGLVLILTQNKPTTEISEITSSPEVPANAARQASASPVPRLYLLSARGSGSLARPSPVIRARIGLFACRARSGSSIIMKQAASPAMSP